jgi:hypothetical protein
MKNNLELVTPRKMREWLRRIGKSQNWLAKQIGISSAGAAAWNRRGGISYRAQILIWEMMKGNYGESAQQCNKTKNTETA